MICPNQISGHATVATGWNSVLMLISVVYAESGPDYFRVENSQKEEPTKIWDFGPEL